MGFFDALLDTRAVDHSDFDIGAELLSSSTSAGIHVDADKAMGLVSAWACITLIADSIRGMPVDVIRKRDAVREPVARPPAWTEYPNRDETWPEFVDYLLHSLLTNGNGYVVVLDRDSLGFPSELRIAHPDDVEVDRIGGRKRIRVNGRELAVFDPRSTRGEVLHIPAHTSDGLKGLSPIEKAAEAIASGLAIEEYGNRFFSNGATASATVEMPAGSVPTQEQLDQLKKQFYRRHQGLKNAWNPVVLANGATYKPMTIPNDQAQFLESARFNVNQIARLYRVPPHLIADVEKSTSWGSGIEQQNIGFVQYTLMPWMTRIESRMSGLLPRGQELKFNANSLLRGDTTARGAFYESLGRLKSITRNEIRALEDLPPFSDGDEPPPAPNESI